jgi:simple sugar transport system permease protein
VLASILFGALFQGGSELAFEIPKVTRDTIVVMQGLVILFSGALAYMNRPLVERVWRLFQGSRPAAGAFTAPVVPAATPAAPVRPTQEVPSPVTTIPADEPLVRVPEPEPPAQAIEPQPPAPPAAHAEPLSTMPAAPTGPIELVEAELVEPPEPLPDADVPWKPAKSARKPRGKRRRPKEGA